VDEEQTNAGCVVVALEYPMEVGRVGRTGEDEAGWGLCETVGWVAQGCYRSLSRLVTPAAVPTSELSITDKEVPPSTPSIAKRSFPGSFPWTLSGGATPDTSSVPNSSDSSDDWEVIPSPAAKPRRPPRTNRTMPGGTTSSMM